MAGERVMSTVSLHKRVEGYLVERHRLGFSDWPGFEAPSPRFRRLTTVARVCQSYNACGSGV